MDARFQQDFDVYESHDASFEDSAFTCNCCMLRPTLRYE